MVIVQDSRERQPLAFTTDAVLTAVKIEALPVGDYMAEYTDGSRAPVVIERKSIPDLFHTMTSGYPRFQREMARAAEARLIVCLGIEGSVSHVLKGIPRSRFEGRSCLRKVCTLFVKHGVVPLFARDRQELAVLVREVFEAYGRTYKTAR